MGQATNRLNEAALRRLLGASEVQELLQRLRQAGGKGPTGALPAVTTISLEQALGTEALERLEQASGLTRQALLDTLATLLPVLANEPAGGRAEDQPGGQAGGQAGGQPGGTNPIPGHNGPSFGYGGAPPGQEGDPPRN